MFMITIVMRWGLQTGSGLQEEPGQHENSIKVSFCGQGRGAERMKETEDANNGWNDGKMEIEEKRDIHNRVNTAGQH